MTTPPEATMKGPKQEMAEMVLSAPCEDGDAPSWWAHKAKELARAFLRTQAPPTPAVQAGTDTPTTAGGMEEVVNALERYIVCCEEDAINGVPLEARAALLIAQSFAERERGLQSERDRYREALKKVQQYGHEHHEWNRYVALVSQAVEEALHPQTKEGKQE